MKAISRRYLTIITASVLLLTALGWVLLRPAGPDPKAIAAAETRMWQAYYAADPLRLHLELTNLLRAQFRLNEADANGIAQHLAMAAWKFETSRENVEVLVLPDLELAFERLRQSTGRSFDARQAARAELAWWIGRRTPGQDGPQQVGRQIGVLYSILYGAERPAFFEAGVLRAEAGRLRDQGGAGCDWNQVEALLLQSYSVMARAL